MSAKHNFYTVKAFSFVVCITFISASDPEELGSDLALISCFTMDIPSPNPRSEVDYKHIPNLEYICRSKDSITLNETHPYFRFEHYINAVDRNPQNKTVPSIQFHDCSMHTFTNDTCDTFPNITRLVAERLNLRVILPTALKNCSELEVLSFFRNNLTVVSEGTFSNLSKLLYINLRRNQIVTLEANLFNYMNENCFPSKTINLRSLILRENKLKQFSPEAIGNKKDLEFIDLSENYLEDVDVEQILKSYPILSFFGFCKDPPMDEERYIKIKEEFENKNITVRCN